MTTNRIFEEYRRLAGEKTSSSYEEDNFREAAPSDLEAVADAYRHARDWLSKSGRKYGAGLSDEERVRVARELLRSYGRICGSILSLAFYSLLSGEAEAR